MTKYWTSKYIAVVILVVVAATLLCGGYGDGATVPVGGADGWGFAMHGWPNGQTFKIGDILVFTYDARFHDVVIVSRENYESCRAIGKKLSLGNDQVRLLSNGTTYYVCGYPGHCVDGVKVAVTAV